MSTQANIDPPPDESRLDRERRFHDARFSAPEPRRESSFYAAVAEAFDAYGALLRDHGAGKTVLELGCGPGAAPFKHDVAFGRYTAIDISPVAVEAAEALARERGVPNAAFQVANAEATGFADASFDLVIGSGILHHLDLEPIYREIARLLRPGGAGVFIEPLGHNPLINAYRAVTPGARTPDEHPLLRADFARARRMFKAVEVQTFGLFTLGALAVRKTPLHRPAHRVLRALDAAALRLPLLKTQAWMAVIALRA